MKHEKKIRKVNFFDILLIILILAIGSGAYWLIHNNRTEGVPVERTYVVELTDLQPEMENYLAVGDQITDNIRNYDLGTITEIEVVPSTTAVLNEEARVFQQVPREDLIMLHLTIRVMTVEDEDSIDTVSNYTLREGAPIYCTAGNLTGSGYILYVDR